MRILSDDFEKKNRLLQFTIISSAIIRQRVEKKAKNGLRVKY